MKMTRVEPASSSRQSSIRIAIVAVFVVVGVSLLNYYGMATVIARVKPTELPMVWQDSTISSHTNATIANQTTVEAESAEPMTLVVEEETEPPAPLFQEQDDPNEIHIVFSMSCAQLHRKTLQTVLQYSATAVGQRGPITQVLSGCTDQEKLEVLQEPTFYYDFRRHFTPAYSPHPQPNVTDEYLPYNKPFSLRHFLQYANPPVTQNVIALIDGDFVFFKELKANTGRSISKYYHGSRDPSTVNDTVTDGVALAQDWSNYMGAGWFASPHHNKVEQVCAGHPECLNVSEADGREYYSGTGPPYIVSRNDFNRMVDDYCNFVVKGRQIQPNEWMVEMYAYALAAGDHGIKHTLLANLGVTHPRFDDGGREYWEFVDSELANPCTDPFAVVMPLDPPVGFHYCQKYGFVLEEGKGYHYYKYALPRDLHECNSPLLKLPPPTEWMIVAMIENEKQRSRKRHEVWAECSMIKIINQAILKFKQRTCPNGFNSFRATILKVE